ncbi:hypothetical protein CNMCM6805_010425 [Aspergillus fumigatiaffinis]|uniref:Fucose-specific lectin n=1 Tax=Aspergillus fumigatiaffinis TaxID=340414 RepID=A0A8H4HFM7_9EURO|nr:hypothetical protein CNMCM5878_005992 [Aspergillus fumigatiaffinis]KAF4243914.1 hypothetical protein CNMCM6805_010425 [Aspergillus fumigatiaffinis]
MPDTPANTIAVVNSEDGRTTYFLCQSDEELYEEKYTGGFEVPVDLGVARLETNATYLLVNDTRAVYCLSEVDTLKDFEFDPETWQWDEGRLEDHGVTAAPETHIEAVVRAGTRREVFFQNRSGQVESVFSKDGQTWEVSGAFPATCPAIGASLRFLQAAEREYLFYSHESNSIHALVFDGVAWKDESIPGSAQGFPVSDIYAEAEGTGYRLQFNDPDGNVYLLVNGEAVKIATIVNGEFIRDNDAQADRLLLEIKAPPRVKGEK